MLVEYDLLPYHRFGEGKYGFMGRVYEMMDFTSPSPETLKRLREVIDEALGRNRGHPPGGRSAHLTIGREPEGLGR